MYNPNMFIATLYFWVDSTNTFQLKYGMITPIFLDVASIIGLRPTDKVFNPKQKVNHNFNFSVRRAAFIHYIFDQHKTDIEDVSDEETLIS